MKVWVSDSHIPVQYEYRNEIATPGFLDLYRHVMEMKNC